MKAVVEAGGRILIPDEIQEAAHLEEGQELDVAYREGVLTMSTDGIPFMDEADEAWWGPNLREELAASIAESTAGKGRVYMSTEEFLAHLEQVDRTDEAH